MPRGVPKDKYGLNGAATAAANVRASLGSLLRTIREAKEHGVTVTVSGAVAGDDEAAPAVGIDIDPMSLTISMSAKVEL